MPRLGYIWRHVILGTHGSWLPGDPRGFRNRRHRLHSSGDYKHPPPQGEHASLHSHNHNLAPHAVQLPPACRAQVGEALRQRFTQEYCRVLALAVAECHVHILAELPRDPALARQIVGRCKGFASFALRDLLPGRLWAQGGSYKPIHDRAHQQRTYHYILQHQQTGAWTWNFQRNAEIQNPGLKGPA